MVHWWLLPLAFYLGMVVQAMMADAKARDKRAGRE